MVLPSHNVLLLTYSHNYVIVSMAENIDVVLLFSTTKRDGNDTDHISIFLL